jgi:hypothetical protein
MIYELLGLKIESFTDLGFFITISLALIYYFGKINAEGFYKKEDKSNNYLRGILQIFHTLIIPLYLINLYFKGELTSILNLNLFIITILQIFFIIIINYFRSIYSINRHDNMNNLKIILTEIEKKYKKMTKAIDKISEFKFIRDLLILIPTMILFINLFLTYIVIFNNSIIFYKLMSAMLFFKFYLIYSLYSSFKENTSYPEVKVKLEEGNEISGKLLQIKDNLIYISNNEKNKIYNLNLEKVIIMEFDK